MAAMMLITIKMIGIDIIASAATYISQLFHPGLFKACTFFSQLGCFGIDMFYKRFYTFILHMSCSYNTILPCIVFPSPYCLQHACL